MYFKSLSTRNVRSPRKLLSEYKVVSRASCSPCKYVDPYYDTFEPTLLMVPTSESPLPDFKFHVYIYIQGVYKVRMREGLINELQSVLSLHWSEDNNHEFQRIET